MKTEMTSTIKDLRESVVKKDEVIISLEAEMKDVKDRAAVNVEIFQKKLADQERKYQAELETWKVAELSRSTYQEVQNSAMLQYETRRPYQQGRHSWEYQHSTTTTQPFISRVRHIQQRPPPPNIVRPLPTYQNNTEFLSAGDFYLQNSNPNFGEEGREDDVDKQTNNKPPVTEQKPKMPVPSKRRKLFNSNLNIL
uniref:Uncharacterized protein n=1 Tax=Graphocephala atropunctata TaxID=36148 RepID=A0A1B6M367_9HEMI